MTIDYSVYPEYTLAYKYTPVLVIAVLMMSFNQFLSSIYTATKHTKNSFWTSFAASVSNLILNFFLIPVWGIQGAAIATFMSYYLCFWARIIDARYYIPFKFNGINNLLNTSALLIMCWMIIGKPFGYVIWTTVLLVFIIYKNYQSLLETVKKVLHR